jgi:hypothetical protein
MKFAILSSTAALALAGHALAAPPALQFSVTSSGAGSASWSSTGAATGTTGQYNYVGKQNEVGFTASYDMNGNDTSVLSRGLLGGSFSLTNNTASTQSFTIDIYLPTVAQGTSSLAGGSVAGLFSADDTAGTFSTVSGTPAWTYYLHTVGAGSNTNIATLLNDPYSVSAGAYGIATIPGQSFGNPIPGLPAAAIGDRMGMKLVFTLTAGDTVDFSSSYVLQAVPAPGACAAMGIAALIGKGRRRRA